MRSNLLDIVISSGLNFLIPKLSNYEDIPSNCFGVFITVKRSKLQRLNKWPEEIHGCIGNWNKNFKHMTKKKLLENIINVSNSATHNDNRRNHFDSIYLDVYALYEITFMMKPVFEINNNGILNNGMEFNNIEYGIIVEDSSGNRATYLPNVFPNKSWNYIKDSLMSKAGTKQKSKFYAYKSVIYEKHIMDLFNKTYFKNYINLFINFMIDIIAIYKKRF